MTVISPYDDYLEDLYCRMHSYAQRRFPQEYFDAGFGRSHRPPVFRSNHADVNLVLPPDEEQARRVIGWLPREARHRWFSSMRSSQALAQSIFGGLAAPGGTDRLNSIPADCGHPAFGGGIGVATLSAEKEIETLNEPRPTTVDVWMERSGYRVAVECKFTEPDFGNCSRPALPGDHPSHCDGTYSRQRTRSERCALTEIGVGYWKHIPALLDWDSESDHSPCPLASTYQVVRNVLAATVQTSGAVNPGAGHAVIVYDNRNPAFWPGGLARDALDRARQALVVHQALRTVSWQAVLEHLRSATGLDWLVDEIADKYGL